MENQKEVSYYRILEGFMEVFYLIVYVLSIK